MRPDIGADEFGACCALSTTEVTGSTITITGTSQFEMRLNAATGGGIDQLYDLVEDPTKTYDLAGGVNDLRTLHDFEIAPNGGAFSGVNHTTEDNSSGSRIELLEATPTRVRVRQDALFQADGGTNILGGIEGVGDYSVYGSGRTAVGWTEKDWNTPLFTYARRQIGMAAHYMAGAPLNSYTPCYEGNGACNSSGAGGAAADWLLGVRNAAGARTDFLTILSQDWVQADTVEYLAMSGAGLEFSDQVWQEAGAGTAASQTWNLLTYFKPTSFTAVVGPQDAAVIGRSTDYRTPDSPGITTGLSWQDADENTASDNFNEAEAAYLFSLDPTLGLRFTMNGSVTNRFAPFFKIRRWRAFHPPATITFDPDAGGATPSVTLVRNVGYVADVKPLSRASFAQDLLWHSTLQDAAAVTAPDVGTGGQVIGSVSFPTARYGAGASVPGIGSYVTARVTDGASLLTGNFDKAKGAVEFWYKPDWASNDFVAHEIAGLFSAASNYFIFQKNVANNLEFRIFASSITSNCSVAAGTLWVANQWVHLRIEWDDTAALGSQQAIFFNGANLNCVPTFDYNSGNLVLGANRDFIFGDADNTDGENGTGVFDEVHIYGGSAAAPQPLAHGGLTSDTREYLRSATSARNFPYAFAPVDTTRRGRYAYFGSDSKWSGLNVYLATAGIGAGALDLQWQFWNGTTWTTLESGYGFTDPTAHLTANGSIYWTGDPAGWKPYSVNGGPDLYYVRAYLTNASATYATPPTESEITTDLLLFQYCSDVTAANQEFIFAAPVATAVGLLSFSATGSDGAVDVIWQTGSEVDNLGFHLHRSLAEDGPWTRVTSSLIPGQGFSATGAAYAWRDAGLQNGDPLLLPPRGCRFEVRFHFPRSRFCDAAGWSHSGAAPSAPRGRWLRRWRLGVRPRRRLLALLPVLGAGPARFLDLVHVRDPRQPRGDVLSHPLAFLPLCSRRARDRRLPHRARRHWPRPRSSPGLRLALRPAGAGAALEARPSRRRRRPPGPHRLHPGPRQPLLLRPPRRRRRLPPGRRRSRRHGATRPPGSRASPLPRCIPSRPGPTRRRGLPGRGQDPRPRADAPALRRLARRPRPFPTPHRPRRLRRGRALRDRTGTPRTYGSPAHDPTRVPTPSSPRHTRGLHSVAFETLFPGRSRPLDLASLRLTGAADPVARLDRRSSG